MKKQRRWAALQTTAAFVTWRFDMLAAKPDAIVHECTEDFDITYLMAIFSNHYIVKSVVFTPRDLGYPVTRTRRYTLMISRERCQPRLQYDIASFGDLFFKIRVAHGDCFMQMPDPWVRQHLHYVAQKQVMDTVDAQGGPINISDPSKLSIALIADTLACLSQPSP